MIRKGEEMTIVEAQGLVKIDPMGATQVHALRGLDMAVEVGEFMSVMGPSGSGKSTLLNLVGCLDTPSEGTVVVDGRHEARQRAAQLLGQVGLGDRLTHRPLEMSGGEQQWVAVARALVNQPAIVLADEPTGNLDTTSGNEIMALLQSLNQGGQTVIIVTHDPSVAARTDRTVYLQDGRVSREERRKVAT
jgi:putative ABC transport system ATP-binding protein